MSDASKQHAHRRVVKIEVRLPVTIELAVGTDDEDPDGRSRR